MKEWQWMLYPWIMNAVANAVAARGKAISPGLTCAFDHPSRRVPYRVVMRLRYMPSQIFSRQAYAYEKSVDTDKI